MIKGFTGIEFHDPIQSKNTKQYSSNFYPSIHTLCNVLAKSLNLNNKNSNVCTSYATTFLLYLLLEKLKFPCIDRKLISITIYKT